MLSQKSSRQELDGGGQGLNFVELSLVSNHKFGYLGTENSDILSYGSKASSYRSPQQGEDVFLIVFVDIM